MTFRRFNKWYAKTNGYFWLPCPSCGKEFGGHERSEGAYSSIPISKSKATGICPDCTKAGVGERAHKEFEAKARVMSGD